MSCSASRSWPGAIVLLLPRLPTLKEWAYAGFTFTWIAATVAHYLAADGKSLLPVALLGLLAVSYVMRPANRRGFAKSMLAPGRRLDPASGVRAGTAASAVASKIFVPDDLQGTEGRRQWMRPSRGARAGRRDAS